MVLNDKSRLFIAIDLPENAISRIMAFQLMMKSAGIHGKWIPKKNIHLTLKFIGDTTSENTDIISGIIADTAKDFRPLSLHVGKPGVFPDIKKPVIAWSGIGGNTEALSKLSETLDRRLFERLGIPMEKRLFKPHVTAARFKNFINSGKLSEIIEECGAMVPHFFIADSIKLYQSRLGSESAEYKILKHVALKNQSK